MIHIKRLLFGLLFIVALSLIIVAAVLTVKYISQLPFAFEIFVAIVILIIAYSIGTTEYEFKD